MFHESADLATRCQGKFGSLFRTRKRKHCASPRLDIVSAIPCLVATTVDAFKGRFLVTGVTKYMRTRDRRPRVCSAYRAALPYAVTLYLASYPTGATAKQ